MTDIQQLSDSRGRALVDPDGTKIGKIDEIYLDDDTGRPEWALVNTGLFGTKSNFVPLRDATLAGDDVHVRYTKDVVKDAPSIDADGALSPNEEAELYSYYGLDYGRTDVANDRDTVGHDVSGPTTDDAMTRSEEELEVGKTERDAGRVRLRKYVDTEQVTKTVPVQHEEIRVEREPITDANVDEAASGPAISEEEHEVRLREEEAVVEKRVVPKERVRLDKDTVTEEQQVTDEVRKERLDVDDDTRR